MGNTTTIASPPYSYSRAKEPKSVFSNAEEVLKYISDEKVEYVDIRFCDLPGVMRRAANAKTRLRSMA